MVKWSVEAVHQFMHTCDSRVNLKFYLITRVVNGLAQNSKNFLSSDKSVHYSKIVEVLLNDEKNPYMMNISDVVMLLVLVSFDEKNFMRGKVYLCKNIPI